MPFSDHVYVSSHEPTGPETRALLMAFFERVRGDDGSLASSVLRWGIENERIERPAILMWRRRSVDGYAARDLLRIHNLGVGVVVLAQRSELRSDARRLLGGSWRHGALGVVAPDDDLSLMQIVGELLTARAARAGGRPWLPRAELHSTVPPSSWGEAGRRI
jgi:hypothetical protein